MHVNVNQAAVNDMWYHVITYFYSTSLSDLLLTWIKFDPTMDKLLHPLNYEWSNYLSTP